jgi:hypothetical protein
MKKLITICAVVVMILAISGAAQAATLVDRGLPTANLNNAAGANRSNVSWVDPDAALMMGDDFTLPTDASLYHIDNIRTWIVGYDATPFSDMFNSVSLYLGTTGSFSLASSSPAVTSVSYSDATTYQGSGGGYHNIYQLDFAVDITASGGTLFDFALVGDGKHDPNEEYISYGRTDYLTFIHASNKDLSGSPQEGSDDVVYAWNISDGSLNYSYNSGTDGGWDKGSDFNVQVEGTVVPEPGTLVLLSLAGLSGLAMMWIRRRRSNG